MEKILFWSLKIILKDFTYNRRCIYFNLKYVKALIINLWEYLIICVIAIIP